MEYTYKIINQTLGQSLQRIEDGAWIPFDENNGDYRAYLIWLAAGNQPIVETL